MNVFYKILFFCFSSLVASTIEINKLQIIGDYKAAEARLKLLQVEKPFDGEINYNLGVLQYKQGKFSEAKENFIRALENLKNNTELLYKTLFNLANSFYKNSLSILGDNWETKDLDQNVLMSAIQEVKKSIEEYKKVINNDKAKINKKYAEDLLKKLEQKKQNQNKQDKEKKEDKNKDKSSKQDQQQNQDKDQDNKEKQKDDNSSDQQEQKNKDQEKNKDKQDQHSKQDQKHKPEQDKNQEKTEQSETGQEAQVKAEDMELKGMRALLENLQSGEEKLQKALINRKIAGNIQQRSDQKNW